MLIFPDWVPVTDGFGYTCQLNDTGYSGRWIAPYTTTVLNQALNLVDPQQRFYAELTNAATYPYKEQIQHSLIPWMTSQRMSLKPVDGYVPNAVDSSGNSADGVWGGQANATNTIQNAAWCEINVEWMLKPMNPFGFNCAVCSVQGSGEFVEMGTERTTYTYQVGTANAADLPGRGGISVITANTPANSPPGTYVPLVNLSKGQTFIEPKDTISIEYPWVDPALVNLNRMRALRGKINLNDILQWYAGTLLYEGSDVESAVSPLGTVGYKITHHFTARNIDWNLIPVMPSGTPPNNGTANGNWNAVSYGWATYKPPMTQTNNGTFPNLPVENKFNSYLNRLYQYQPMFSYTGNALNYWAVSDLFYYGFNPNASWYSPPVNPLPIPG